MTRHPCSHCPWVREAWVNFLLTVEETSEALAEAWFDPLAWCEHSETFRTTYTAGLLI